MVIIKLLYETKEYSQSVIEILSNIKPKIKRFKTKVNQLFIGQFY